MSMKFEVSCVSVCFFEEGDSLLNYYPQLAQFGAVKKKDGDVIISISTLEELMQLQESVHEQLIIAGNSITIYDDYIE